MLVQEESLDLLTERLNKILEEIIADAEKSFSEGAPYYILRRRWLQKKLHGSRGLQFILKKLRKRYKITEDGSWYILRKLEQ